MSRVILGVDPGLTRCGVGVIESSAGRKIKLIAVDTLRSEPKEELSLRIGSLAVELEAIIKKHQPNAIALERVFSQQNVSTVMGTAQISGVVLMLANKYGIPIALHTPTEVKAAVTGSGRAKKDQVGFMVAKLLGLAEIPKPADAADALAIAICNAWSSSADAELKTEAQKKWAEAIRTTRSKSR